MRWLIAGAIVFVVVFVAALLAPWEDGNGAD